MPAIITHHIFGEDASVLLPADVLTTQEELLAFLLGNQGTDPLWARFTCLPPTLRACHLTATAAHTGKVVEALTSMREAATLLEGDARGLARAFGLGYLAHFLLDALCHPLIIALTRELAAADVSLAQAASEVHALIEADIDSWMLYQKRGITIEESSCTDALAHTPRMAEVAGALVAGMAREVYGIELGVREYGRALADYRLLYRVIDPPAGRLAHVLETAEELVRPHSRLRAQAHRIVTEDEHAFANLEHHLWHDPATGERSCASIADLFHDALIVWPALSTYYLEGDLTRVSRMVANLNHYGLPDGTPSPTTVWV